MGRHDAGTDGEADAGALGISTGSRPLEHLEDAGVILAIDADALVSHMNEPLVGAALAPDVDLWRFLAAKPHRVAQEVLEYQPELDRIAA